MHLITRRTRAFICIAHIIISRHGGCAGVQGGWGRICRPLPSPLSPLPSPLSPLSSPLSSQLSAGCSVQSNREPSRLNDIRGQSVHAQSQQNWRVTLEDSETDRIVQCLGSVRRLLRDAAYCQAGFSPPSTRQAGWLQMGGGQPLRHSAGPSGQTIWLRSPTTWSPSRGWMRRRDCCVHLHATLRRTTPARVNSEAAYTVVRRGQDLRERKPER